MNLTAADYIKNATLPVMRLEPLWEDNLIGIQYWCRDYHKHTKFPVDTKDRFAIAFYQIHQGIDWAEKNSTYNKHESFAAAAIHLLCVAEVLGMGMELEVELEIKSIPHMYIAEKALRLLRDLSKIQQQLFYATAATERGRNRLNKVHTRECLGRCVTMLLGFIDPEQRKQALHDATTLMTKDLK